MNPGAGDSDSRRRGVFATTLLSPVTCLSLFRCFIYGFPVCFTWLFGGRIPRRTARWRHEWRLFVALFPMVFALQMASLPATSREGSLTAALLWSSNSTPDEPLPGCWTSHDVDSVQALKPMLEHRSQLTNSTSLSPVRIESPKLQGFALLFIGARFHRATRLKPCFFGSSSPDPTLKVLLSPYKRTLFDGGICRWASSTDERFISNTPRPILTEYSGLIFHFAWAWPICETTPVSPINCSPRFVFLKGKSKQILKVFGDWVIFSKTSCCLTSYFSFGMYLPMDSSGLVLFRSFSSFEENMLPPYSLPMARDVSSDLLPNICSSTLIGLSFCVAVSTGPEDTIEITMVVFVDETWTSTSLYVTILQLSDFVVKANPTHSSIVLDLLSSSIEDLSCLAYFYVATYVYCQRGWIIPSIYCIGKD